MKRLDLPIGSPIPEHYSHGVSVSLPTLDSVIGYEEKRPDVISALQQGYPRFVTPAATEALRLSMQHIYGSDDNGVWIFPSHQAAKECVEFIGSGEIVSTHDGLYVVIALKSYASKAKEFMQHSGHIVSSRLAEALLEAKPGRSRDDMLQTKRIIRERIVAFTNKDAAFPVHIDDVYLGVTGMSSIYTAHRMITRENCRKSTIQLGFPYVDTLKIQEKFNPEGEGIYIPYRNCDDINLVEQQLQTQNISAVFCEITANPLLNTVDVKRLRVLLDRYDVSLVIDNTVGSWQDTDVTAYADITVTSLTKSFVGNAGAMGGALTLHRHSPRYTTYASWMKQYHEDILYDEDACVLEEGSRDCAERTLIVNRNAYLLAEYLNNHPAVKDVRYPLFHDRHAYDAIRKPEGGYGALLSIILHDPLHAYEAHDRLDVRKGPSLGTHFTLASLYTLMAHYDEQEWAADNGVPSHLIRVAVGAEDDLIERFRQALA